MDKPANLSSLAPLHSTHPLGYRASPRLLSTLGILSKFLLQEEGVVVGQDTLLNLANPVTIV